MLPLPRMGVAKAHYEEFDAVSSDDEWCNKRHRSNQRQPWEEQAHHQVLESYFQLVESLGGETGPGYGTVSEGNGSGDQF